MPVRKGSNAVIVPRRLDLRYVTPEWQYAVRDLSSYGAWWFGIAIYGTWLWIVLGFNPFGWSGGEQLVACIAGVAGAYCSAGSLNKALAHAGGGYGSARLQAESLPGRFRIRSGRKWHVFDATAPHAFSMREHLLRYEEGRAEERARADGMAQGADFYRRSWEIILDYRAHRMQLAAVGNEEAARSIIRELHELDEYARGAVGAGTKTRNDEQIGAAPSGQRPELD